MTAITRRPARPLFFLGLLSGLAPLATARQAGFVELGDLPGGSLDSTAFGLNADGSVVVGSSSSAQAGPHQEAFRWTAGGIVGLGDLPGGSFVSVAFGTDAAGSVVVGESNAGTLPEAFRWTSGGMVGLGSLAGGIAMSSARGVSADGTTIVGTSHSSTGFEAFRWTAAGGMVGLGGLPGSNFFSSSAHAVSATGDVVVGASEGITGLEAYRWTAAGGMVGLGYLPGAAVSSFATAVNADGSVVVGASESTLGAEAFRWTAAGGMVGLGSLPGGDSGEARGTNADGSVVVGFDHSTASGFRATVWTPTLGLVELKEHLISLGAVGLDGWRLRMAEAISPDGNAIVGWGDNPSGAKEAWLAFFSAPPIGTAYCTPALPNSTGSSGSITAIGSSVVETNAFQLTARDLPPGQFGYFLAGQTQGFSNPPGSQGLLCLAGNIGRFNALPLIIQGPSGSTRIDLSSVPVNPPTAVLPGDTWNFQCWYRDNNPSLTNNFTDAVSVVFQ
ncbi:MAG: PEP-CTERM sorting domain-containing protein [bacterium]|nr:PEP-CTERM sorting domain-containing protein [bacterium]